MYHQYPPSQSPRWCNHGLTSVRILSSCFGQILPYTWCVFLQIFHQLPLDPWLCASHLPNLYVELSTVLYRDLILSVAISSGISLFLLLYCPVVAYSGKEPLGFSGRWSSGKFVCLLEQTLPHMFAESFVVVIAVACVFALLRNSSMCLEFLVSCLLSILDLGEQAKTQAGSFTAY